MRKHNFVEWSQIEDINLDEVQAALDSSFMLCNELSQFFNSPEERKHKRARERDVEVRLSNLGPDFHIDRFPEKATWDFKHWILEGELPPPYYGFLIGDYIAKLTDEQRNNFLQASSEFTSSSQITRALLSITPRPTFSTVGATEKAECRTQLEALKKLTSLDDDQKEELKVLEEKAKFIGYQEAVEKMNTVGDAAKEQSNAELGDHLAKNLFKGDSFAAASSQLKAIIFKGDGFEQTCQSMKDTLHPPPSTGAIDGSAQQPEPNQAGILLACGDAITQLVEQNKDEALKTPQSRQWLEISEEIGEFFMSESKKLDADFNGIASPTPQQKEQYELDKKNLGAVARAWGNATAGLGLDPWGYKITDCYSATTTDYLVCQCDPPEEIAKCETCKQNKIMSRGDRFVNTEKSKLTPPERGWCDMDIPQAMWSKSANFDRYRNTKVHLYVPNSTTDISKPTNLRVTHQELQVGTRWDALDASSKPLDITTVLTVDNAQDTPHKRRNSQNHLIDNVHKVWKGKKEKIAQAIADASVQFDDDFVDDLADDTLEDKD